MGTLGICSIPFFTTTNQQQFFWEIILVQPDRTAHLELEYVQLIGAGSVATFAGGPIGGMGVHEMA